MIEKETSNLCIYFFACVFFQYFEIIHGIGKLYLSCRFLLHNVSVLLSHWISLNSDFWNPDSTKCYTFFFFTQTSWECVWYIGGWYIAKYGTNLYSYVHYTISSIFMYNNAQKLLTVNLAFHCAASVRSSRMAFCSLLMSHTWINRSQKVTNMSSGVE